MALQTLQRTVEKSRYKRGVCLTIGETYGVNLQNEIMENLYILGKKIFYGDEDLSDTYSSPDITNRLASIASKRKRSHLCVQTDHLKPFIETRFGYYRFYNPYFLSRKILSPPRIEPRFIGQYPRKVDAGGRVQFPSQVKNVFDENPVLIPNQIIFRDETVKYLLLSPQEVWRKQKAIAILASKRADKLYRGISLNTYRPSLDSYSRIMLSKSQKEWIGIRKNGGVTVLGTGTDVEIWARKKWLGEEAYIEAHRKEIEFELWLRQNPRQIPSLFTDDPIYI